MNKAIDKIKNCWTLNIYLLFQLNLLYVNIHFSN